MNPSLLDVDDIEELNLAPAGVPLTYRQFREAVLAECIEDRHRTWRPYHAKPEFGMLRERIRAFRRHLIYSAVTWIESGRYPAGHIYRALGLDRTFTLEVSRRDRWRRARMWWVMPHTVLRLAHPWLRMARTYEGREFIMRELVPRGFPSHNIHYTRALDFGIMRWGRFASTAIVNDFSRLQMEWIKAARALGLDDPVSMIEWIPSPSSNNAGKLMWLLVREKVILDLTEQEWVTRWSRRSYSSEPELEEKQIVDVIPILLEHGVTREQIVKALCTLPHHYLDPARLLTTLTLLEARGVNSHTVLLDGLGICLFDTAIERWLFVIDTLGVHDAATILQFRPLLQTERPYSVELAAALIAHGAGAAELVRCQDLLLAAGAAGLGSAPATALAVLMAAPYHLSLEQVPDAGTYLCQSGDLPAFLAVLAKYGFGNPAVALRFQPCYGNVHPDVLSRLIALTQAMTKIDAVGDVLDWLSDSGTTGYIDAYEYLARTLKVRTISQLRQVAKLGFLGVGILRYLIEEQGLARKTALMDWFYGRAFGIKSLQWWGSELDPVNKLLFEDAFNRQSFNYWESNRRCIVEIVDRRVGPFPYRGTDEEKQRYRASYEPACEAERAALLPLLPRMLQATSGILLAGMVPPAGEGIEALGQQLDRLAPLLDELLVGRGPKDPVLSELEKDAIALIYRTAPYTVHTLWSAVVGRQDDISDWSLAPSYQMKWHSASWALEAPLDKSGFEVVGRSAQWAATFRAQWHSDPDSAFAGVMPSEEKQTIDLEDLVPQLGLLLAIAADDTIAAVWLESIPALLAVSDERGYEHVLRMHAFFNIGLNDALQARRDAFCGTLTDRSALLLARKLGAVPDGHHTAQAVLHAALDRIAQNVHAQFGGWASRELAKFGSDNDDGASVTMNAFVSKHPAAFFAKEAVKLCTAGNVKMWQEPRHAHLVVFDSVHRSLQGMALLYREILKPLHPSRPVLVIRAINPTDDAMARYHVSSIVDAFLSTAVEIARKSGCVAVALPPNSGMHLLSNLDPVDKDLRDRYIEPHRVSQTQLSLSETEVSIRPALPISVTFDAYEQKANTVGMLYVVWRNSLKE
jgi:hypothetical protein